MHHLEVCLPACGVCLELTAAGPGFSLGGGGGARDYVPARTYTSAEPNSLFVGVQGLLKGPGSSWGFYAISCYLSLVFKHSDTKWAKKKKSQSNFRGEGAPIAPPLDPPLFHLRHDLVEVGTI